MDISVVLGSAKYAHILHDLPPPPSMLSLNMSNWNKDTRVPVSPSLDQPLWFLDSS